MTEISAWESYKKNLGASRPWDLINPNTEWSSSEISDKRVSICKQCPEFIKVTSQCKKCGCFMTAKAKLKNASCPLSKWNNE
jgi:hypothetical protein